jgi:hypothetical protein
MFLFGLMAIIGSKLSRLVKWERAMTTNVQKLDPAADHLLDFIAGGVPTNEMGESGGCYDATFGDIDGSTYGCLADKNFNEIYAMQDQMLRDNGISTATGRYQALKSTLEEYQNRVGLTDTSRFTEAVQDDFGLRKMEDRGYNSWLDHGINDNEFMHRLSCEWASLPDPYNGGKSHYDGDSAGNHASTSLGNFQAAVTQARKLQEDNTRVDLPQMDPDAAIREIQRILVRTGDLPISGIDGAWGPQSEGALNSMIARDK